MKVNEIFYSLQGEGANTGTPAIFIRFSGCNLRCPFCDTQHQEGEFMSASDIVRRVSELNAINRSAAKPLIVYTGGEPTICDLGVLTANLQAKGYKVAIETNGTNNPEWLSLVDFITLSPKFEFCKHAELAIKRATELKVVFNGQTDMNAYNDIIADYYYLQPCDTGDKEKNKTIIEGCIAFVKANPKWRLSLQTQKILGIL